MDPMLFIQQILKKIKKEVRREKVLFYHLNAFALSRSSEKEFQREEFQRQPMQEVSHGREAGLAFGPALACFHHHHPHGQELSGPTACCPGPSLAALEIKTRRELVECQPSHLHGPAPLSLLLGPPHLLLSLLATGPGPQLTSPATPSLPNHGQRRQPPLPPVPHISSRNNKSHTLYGFKTIECLPSWSQMKAKGKCPCRQR